MSSFNEAILHCLHALAGQLQYNSDAEKNDVSQMLNEAEGYLQADNASSFNYVMLDMVKYLVQKEGLNNVDGRVPGKYLEFEYLI